MQAILSRPLFAPNRRAPVGIAAGGVSTGLPRLAGIMISNSGRSVIFAAADGGKPNVVAEGAEVSGFRVQSIENGQVTVVGPDGSRVLRPSFDPAPRQAATIQPQPTLPGPFALPGPGVPAGVAAR